MSKSSIWWQAAGGAVAVTLILLLTSCAAPQPTSVISPVSTQAPSPIATPSVSQRPIPQSGLGGATGRIVAESTNGPAYVGGDLFLGRLVLGSDPKAQPMVAFSNDSDPKSSINPADGRFDFTDIAPGEYALVVWNPTASFVVEVPNGGGLVKVKIEADKVIDLNTIVIP